MCAPAVQEVHMPWSPARNLMGKFSLSPVFFALVRVRARAHFGPSARLCGPSPWHP